MPDEGSQEHPVQTPTDHAQDTRHRGNGGGGRHQDAPTSQPNVQADEERRRSEEAQRLRELQTREAISRQQQLLAMQRKQEAEAKAVADAKAAENRPFEAHTTPSVKNTESALDRQLKNHMGNIIHGPERNRTTPLVGAAPLFASVAAHVEAGSQAFTEMGSFGVAGLAAGVLSPLMETVRRVATGRNAMTQWADWTRRAKQGFVNRIFYGLEAKAVEGEMFGLDSHMQKLNQFKQNGVDVKSLVLGGQKYIEDLVAHGFYAGAKLDWIRQSGIEIGEKYRDKMTALSNVYDSAKEVFESHFTAGQRERFIREKMDAMVGKLEQSQFVRQTAKIGAAAAVKGLAGVGILKTFALDNITKVADIGLHAVTGVGDWAKGVLGVGVQKFTEAQAWASRAMVDVSKTFAKAGTQPAAGPGW